MEDFISANNVELLYVNEDPLLYLLYGESNTNLDLTLASIDITELALRKMIDVDIWHKYREGKVIILN